MKYIAILFFCLLPFVVVNAQPGFVHFDKEDFSASFRDERNRAITPQNEEFEIKWIRLTEKLLTSDKWESISDTLSFKTDILEESRRTITDDTIHILNDSIYTISIGRIPGRRGIAEGSHFLLIRNNTDTMRLYPPAGCLELENVYFRKGNYKIPQLAYIFHKNLKKETRKLFRPNLYDDWDLFRIENQDPIYKKIYVECIELFTPKNSASMLHSLRPRYDSNNHFIKKYFEDTSSLGQFIGVGNVYSVNEDLRGEDYHSFFGVFPSGIFIYQKDETSPFQYGYLTVPIDTTNVSRTDSRGNDRFFQGFYNETTMSEVLSIKGYNETGAYDMLGYYPGIRQYTESLGAIKEMWGFYKIHITPLSNTEFKRIARKHAKQNNLLHEDKKAMEKHIRFLRSR